MIKPLSAFVFAIMVAGSASAQDASNLYPGVTASDLMTTAPVHWVSVEQIAASLERQPAMTVGFDVDDTVLFSSPCFHYGKMKYSPDSEDYLGMDEFGPVAVWCRSFDSIMCSKGDELWARPERMNFERMQCGSP